MNEKDNPLRNVELSIEQSYNLIDSNINNLRHTLPEPPEKPLDKVKAPPSRKRSREREER